uniref:Small ribosomal subunit protein uS3m n=1 Tax=Graphis lineola TaxID=1257147 RepID=A0A286QSH1_9LECA|nr:ribosomal protein subunit 3 [Graphis lineola]ASB29167.1 ribosomal protein subunit 3 [Graphis lineola]
MLNILKLKKKNTIPISKNKSGDYSGKVKDTVPANKEWFDSIYVFNKNNLKLLPVQTNIISSTVKSYFYMFFNELEKIKSKKKKHIIPRIKSVRKIWVSKPEIKHTNNKLTITLYVYNRQYNIFFKKLSKIQKQIFPIWKKRNISSVTLKTISIVNTLSSILLKILKNKNNVNLDILKYKKVNNNNFFIECIKKVLNKEMSYLTLKQLMLFNKFKFNNYVIRLKDILKKIYKKNVDFNLVSLNNFHLNSSILSQILTTKIKSKKNRAIKVIKASLRKIKTPILNQRTVKREDKLLQVQNLIVSNFLEKDKNYLKLGVSKRVKSLKNIDLEDAVLSNTKYKLVNGITLKASGRITRRIIAERARFSIRSIGTLKNVNTSYKGLSSVMVRGYEKSNIDSTLLWSKTHVGAFGLKGWVSSY